MVMAMGGPAFSYESHKSSHSIASVFGAAAKAAICEASPETVKQIRRSGGAQGNAIALAVAEADAGEVRFFGDIVNNPKAKRPILQLVARVDRF
jgi:hypothetical protein